MSVGEDVAVERRARWAWPALVVVMVASLARQLAWALARSPEVLMRRAPADDGFIYLALAERAPRPEFTDGIVTTGFHPLWWAMLAPVVHLADGLAAVRIALVLAVLLHLASGALLFAALRQRHALLAAWGAAAAWIVLPGARTIVVMGVESGLLACTLALLLWLVLRPGPAGRRRVLLVGAAVGLAYLARTDSPIVTIPIVVAWVTLGSRSARRRLVALAAAGGAAFIVALPWLVHAGAQGALRHGSDAFRAERQGTSWSLLIATEKRAAAELYLLNGAGRARLSVGGTVSNGLLAIGLALLVWALVRRRDRIALAGLAGTAALLVAYGAMLGYLRDWYLLYPLFALCAFALPVAVEVVEHRASAWVAPVLVVAVVVGAIAVPNHVLNPQEGDKYLAAGVAEGLLAPDARVGAFNAGIFQFLLPQDVVNLDGVVNPDVLAFRGPGLCDYLVAEQIDHLLDYRLYLDRAQAADPRLQFTERTDLTAIYAPDGDGVDQRQELVTVDLDACAGAP